VGDRKNHPAAIAAAPRSSTDRAGLRPGESGLPIDTNWARRRFQNILGARFANHEFFEPDLEPQISSPACRSPPLNRRGWRKGPATTRVSGALREHGPALQTAGAHNDGGQAVFRHRSDPQRKAKCCGRPPWPTTRKPWKCCVRGPYSGRRQPQRPFQAYATEPGVEPEQHTNRNLCGEMKLFIIDNWRWPRRALLSRTGKRLPKGRLSEVVLHLPGSSRPPLRCRRRQPNGQPADPAHPARMKGAGFVFDVKAPGFQAMRSDPVEMHFSLRTDAFRGTF